MMKKIIETLSKSFNVSVAIHMRREAIEGWNRNNDKGSKISNLLIKKIAVLL